MSGPPTSETVAVPRALKRSTRREYDLAVRGLTTALNQMRQAEDSLRFARKRVHEAKQAHDQYCADHQKGLR